MKTFKSSTLVILLSVLMGCGGGGESESNPAPAATTPPPVVADPPPADNTVKTTADIVADADFDFSTKFNLNVDVKFAGLDQRAYLNVCLAPSEGEKLNINSCLFRSPLNSSGLKESIMISHSEIKLIAQIWFYDGSTIPQEYEWEYQSNQSEQSFIIR